MKTFKELMDEFVEALKRKVVYRNGKRVVKKVTDKDGYKVVKVDGKEKEVKMSSKEKIARKKAAKIAARKRKSKSSQIAKKRARTMKKRGKK
jgi:hypothetical protein|tara:strand:+ start:176 stop:451 length:276 start_codon:yes stop_codon:yes gene_type:complete